MTARICKTLRTAVLIVIWTIPASREAFTQTQINLEFVKILPGQFMMGCSAGDSLCSVEEKPAHRVRITKPFEIGKYEVTQGQWDATMLGDPGPLKGADLPSRVSWDDAQEFLRRLNARNDGYRYRLPTEAEWEYAARAGSKGAYAGPLDQTGWYQQNSGGQIHPAGQKQPNAWGLYDMHGNVWEWVADRYDDKYYQSSPAQDPPGPSSGESRVLRGGSFNSVDRLERVSVRMGDVPAFRYANVGFRCVREAIHPVLLTVLTW
jgi:formylglycine-generating enzyme required for sulfatase activity